MRIKCSYARFFINRKRKGRKSYRNLWMCKSIIWFVRCGLSTLQIRLNNCFLSVALIFLLKNNQWKITLGICSMHFWWRNYNNLMNKSWVVISTKCIVILSKIIMKFDFLLKFLTVYLKNSWCLNSIIIGIKRQAFHLMFKVVLSTHCAFGVVCFLT